MAISFTDHQLGNFKKIILVLVLGHEGHRDKEKADRLTRN